MAIEPSRAGRQRHKTRKELTRPLPHGRRQIRMAAQHPSVSDCFEAS